MRGVVVDVRMDVELWSVVGVNELQEAEFVLMPMTLLALGGDNGVSGGLR
jgi:hypothetical protein